MNSPRQDPSRPSRRGSDASWDALVSAARRDLPPEVDVVHAVRGVLAADAMAAASTRAGEAALGGLGLWGSWAQWFGSPAGLSVAGVGAVAGAGIAWIAALAAWSSIAPYLQLLALTTS